MTRALAFCLLTVGLGACTEHSPDWYNLTDEAPDTTSTTAESDTPADTKAASSEDAGTTAASTGGAEAGHDAGGDPGTMTGTMTGTTGGHGETTGPMATTRDESGGTTGSSAFCGDGVINQDFEECDIPSPDPEGPCTAICQRQRTIFVLSISVKGKLSGLQGADAYCKSQATMAMKVDPSSPIKDPNNFKALLSTSKESVFERHFRGEGPYRLVNGLTVSDSFDALFTAPLQNPINVDEFGHTRNTAVWTASTIDGLPYPGIDFCGDWESNEGSSSWGRSDYTDSMWIDVGDVVGNPATPCYDNFALYCLEQE